jgi:DNA-directed RNA polymerase subunit L
MTRAAQQLIEDKIYRIRNAAVEALQRAQQLAVARALDEHQELLDSLRLEFRNVMIDYEAWQARVKAAGFSVRHNFQSNSPVTLEVSGEARTAVERPFADRRRLIHEKTEEAVLAALLGEDSNNIIELFKQFETDLNQLIKESAS